MINADDQSNINRKGNIIQMVREKNIAWHAGISKWKKFKNLNASSIGIELVNKGHRLGYENFTKNQIKSLIKICKILKKKYRIKKENFLAFFWPVEICEILVRLLIVKGNKLVYIITRRNRLGSG